MPKGIPVPHNYTDDDLRHAIEDARSWREIQRRLGLVHSGLTTKKLKAAAERLGLSVESVPRSHAKHTEAQLRAAVEQATCYSDVLRILGLALAGGNHAHISRRIRALGIDTSHFDPAANRRKVPTRGRPTPQQILVRRPRGSKRLEAQTLRRAMIALGIDERCATCGCGPEWLGAFLRLEIDHIDGDWLNNLLENLRFLCPNCHTQTETFARYKRRQAI